MYDRILLPTDASDQRAAVDQALDLAELADATLHVLYVVDEEALDFRTTTEAREATREELRAEGTEATERIAEQASERGVAVETALDEGTPAETIVDYADAHGIDVVVMGTSGRSGVGRYVLGSVTEQVVRTSAVPVLTVNLARQERAVGDDEAAIERARGAVTDEGHEVAAVPEEPYRERNTWIVRVETDDGGTFNVHVDAESGDARLARIRG